MNISRSVFRGFSVMVIFASARDYCVVCLSHTVRHAVRGENQRREGEIPLSPLVFPLELSFPYPLSSRFTSASVLTAHARSYALAHMQKKSFR